MCLQDLTRKAFSFVLVVCLLSVLLPGLCLASEAETMTISINDYNNLKNELQQLKLNNEKQQKLLTQLKEQLTQSQTMQKQSIQDWLKLEQQLKEAEAKAQLLESQCRMLDQQLSSAKQASLTAQSALNDANQSLKELNKTIKQERAAADRREFTLKLIAAGAIICAIRK